MARGVLSRLALLAWEAPQNTLGAANLALWALRRRVRRVRWERDRVLVEIDGVGSVSLGLFVFHCSADTPYVPVGPENVDHEYGHSIQSRRFGPLYLPLVGVPSVMRVGYAVAYRTVRGRRWAHYYDGWPERQADELGGVDRALRPAP